MNCVRAFQAESSAGAKALRQELEYVKGSAKRPMRLDRLKGKMGEDESEGC